MPSIKDDYWKDSRLLRKPIKALEVNRSVNKAILKTLNLIQFSGEMENRPSISSSQRSCEAAY